MSVPRFFYDDTYTGAIDDESRFPRHRYRLVREALEQRGLAGRWLQIEPPRRATIEELELVHDSEYVENFLTGHLADDQVRRIGFRPWTDAFVERTLRLTGGTLAAYEQIADGAVIAGNLAGGTHHAFADAGAGYCVFNDIAICARRALREDVADEVVIIDLDVHQGDGTASLFEREARVATYSLHCAENFPFRKQSSDRDVAVDEGSGDEIYLDRLRGTLPNFLETHRPDLVIYQAGVDALGADRHGRLELTLRGLRRRNRLVIEWVDKLDAPLLITMGGGYAEPITRSVTAHADVFEAAVRRDSTKPVAN
jgi:acetoin utilization deacetylase AcuC-like enzyme